MAKKKLVVKPKLVQALEFLCLTKADYCLMDQRIARAFDSILAAGTHIEEDLSCNPQPSLLLLAILRCADEYAITQLSPSKLLVRSADFQAYIPCDISNLLSWPIPDAPVTAIDDRLIEAMRKVAPLVSTTGDTVVECSVQLNSGSVIATNLMVILEAWHGIDLPSGLLIPKVAINAIHKSGKHLASFGYSPKTATFYFTDDTWLRTQLYQEKWPDVASFLNIELNTRPVPPDLFKAAKKVAPFSVTQKVYIKDSLISSHPLDAKEEGALQLPIGANEHGERIYGSRNLALVAPHATLWDEYARPDATAFLGDNIRGVISHEEFPSNQPIVTSFLDDDIPF